MKEFSKFYVYGHVDPSDDSEGGFVYIGKGSGSRAWECNRTLRKDVTHYNWIREKLESGWTPDDFVVIIKSNMSQRDACDFERRTIKQLKPKFNVLGCKDLVKLTETQRKRIAELRERGFSYERIAKRVNSTAMTVWRFLNKKEEA